MMDQDRVPEWMKVERYFRRYRDRRVPVSLPTKETLACLRSEWPHSEELVECES